jgi:hypothetical protein
MEEADFSRFLFVAPEPTQFLRIALKKSTIKGSMYSRYANPPSTPSNTNTKPELPPSATKTHDPAQSIDKILCKLDQLRTEKKKLFETIRNSTQRKEHVPFITEQHHQIHHQFSESSIVGVSI